MSGKATFLISLANSLCLFLKTQTVLLSFSRAHRLLVCYTAVFRVERCVTTLKTAVLQTDRLASSLSLSSILAE